MRYLLDTNVWIHYLKNSNSSIEARLRTTPVGDIAACSIVRAELLHGARKYGNKERRVQLVEQTLAPFCSLPFDDAAAQHYAKIRDQLEIRGEVIGPNDLMIAAIAMQHGLTIVSSNREFQRVAPLSVQDWFVTTG
jgi:tRNA(fMet)-specific endonuclease VapC